MVSSTVAMATATTCHHRMFGPYRPPPGVSLMLDPLVEHRRRAMTGQTQV